MKHLLSATVFALFFCMGGNAFAQESCTEDDQSALESCLSDAADACKATYPGCESSGLSVTDTLALLDERCGACEDAKNFGKYNSCLKRFRNGLRKLGALSNEIKDALGAVRASCKELKKGSKKGNNGKPGEEE